MGETLRTKFIPAKGWAVADCSGHIFGDTFCYRKSESVQLYKELYDVSNNKWRKSRTCRAIPVVVALVGAQQ